jgi:dipeptidyl aminopeptidase/acylaminoacyl peptidase
MRILAGLCLALVMASGSAIIGLGTGAAHAADLAVYGKLPTIEDVGLSPDGKFLATIETNGEQRRVIVRNLDTRAVVMGVDAGSRKVRYLEWADSQNLIVVITTTTNLASSNIQATLGDYARGIVLNVTARTQRPLIGKHAEESLNVVNGRPVLRTERGQTVVYVPGIAFNDGQGVLSIFKVYIANGVTQLMATGTHETSEFLINADGQVVAERLHNDRTDESGLLLRKGNSLQRVALPTDFKSDFNLIGFGPDGQSLLARYRNADHSVVAEISPGDSVWRPATYLRPEDDVMTDYRTDRFMGSLEEVGDRLTYRFADPADQKAWNAILAAFPGERVTLGGMSADHKRMVVQDDSPTDGPALSLIDLTTGKGQVIGDVYKGLTPADVSPVKTLSYKAADGLRLTGYLTTPKSAGPAPKALPLVVLVHGGPAARDDLSFDWWSQAMAAQGYAVLRVNYRGSEGFGHDFMEAGYGQWGKKMQTDVSDGVRYLAAEGAIDPKRVCIVGASYGGYAALAGATLDRGVYRCAASIAGPADLRKLLTIARDDHGQTNLRYWNKFMGVEGVNDPGLTAISPALHASDVDVPVLLIHGKDDSVVLYEQSQIMADALKKAGKPYEFVTLDGEDHWLSSGATRLKMLQSVVAFLQKNNPVN